MEALNSIFWFAIVITIVVFLHEMGHYLIARLFGVKVSAFSIGFGQEILGYTSKKTGTRWKLSLIPLGGYVKFAGDDNIFSAPCEGKPSTEESYTLSSKKAWQKMLIAFAGPFANYLTAFIIFSILFIYLGKTIIFPEITEILPNSPAEKYELRVGDEIIAFNDKPITDIAELKQKLFNITPHTETIVLKIKRENNILDIPLKLEFMEIEDVNKDKIKMAYIGIKTEHYELQKLSIKQAMIEGIKECRNLSIAVLTAIWQLITGERDISSLGGPIKIAQYSNSSASQGMLAFFLFIAAISVNLGLVNLIPLPILDGGHIMISLMEWVRGGPLPHIFYRISYLLGIIIIAMLMILTIGNDILHLIKKW